MWDDEAERLLHSKDEKIIINGVSIKDEFDDIDASWYGYWARICRKHSKEERYKNIGFMDCEYDADTGALCDCHGCRNKAAFYIDFFIETPELKALFGDEVNCRKEFKNVGKK